jgi:hypothetical protein
MPQRRTAVSVVPCRASPANVSGSAPAGGDAAERSTCARASVGWGRQGQMRAERGARAGVAIAAAPRCFQHATSKSEPQIYRTQVDGL